MTLRANWEPLRRRERNTILGVDEYARPLEGRSRCVCRSCYQKLSHVVVLQNDISALQEVVDEIIRTYL